MSAYTVGQLLPEVVFNTTTVGVIAANIVTVDFFPGLIDPDYARSAGHRTVFMNTMSLLSLMDRFVLDIVPEGRIKSHEIAMRKPAYAGMALAIAGEVTAVSPFSGSRLVGAGSALDITVTVSAEGERCASGKVTVVVPYKDVL